MYQQRGIAVGQTVDYYPAFDYLRICLAISVAANHVGLLFWEQSGNFPVQVFFAMSGWLIGGILLKSELRDLPRFYFNRAARIWIPYFIAILLLVSVSAVREHIKPKWAEFVFYKVTFVYDIFAPPQLGDFQDAMPLKGTGHHFWSICAEEQFYLLAPLLIIVVPIGRSIWFWSAVSAVVVCGMYSNYFGSISIGVLVAVIQKRHGDWHQSPVARFVIFAFVAILFPIMFFEVLPYQYVAPALSIGIVLFLAQYGEQSKAGEFLGGVSYSFYLNHWIGIFAAHAIFSKFGLRDSLGSKISSIIISFAAASLLYIAVDRNIKKYRSLFFTTERGKIAAGIGYALVFTGMVVGIYLTS